MCKHQGTTSGAGVKARLEGAYEWLRDAIQTFLEVAGKGRSGGGAGHGGDLEDADGGPRRGSGG